MTTKTNAYSYRDQLLAKNKACFARWNRDTAFRELDRANAGEDRRSDDLRILRASGFRG